MVESKARAETRKMKTVKYPTGLCDLVGKVDAEAEVITRTLSSQRRSPVSMAIRRHEIYGKSRRSVSSLTASVNHSSLKQRTYLSALQTHLKCLVKFGL